MNIALLIQFVSSISIATLILLVQVLIYPQFLKVGQNELQNYAKAHQRRISYIVIPVALAEFFSLIAVWFFVNQALLYLWIASFLLILVWLLTFIKIVPLHRKIEEFGEKNEIEKLVDYNLIRTFFWLLKTFFIFLIYLIYL